MTPDIISKLAEPFPESDIQMDRPGLDGFQPSFIPWDKITLRLDQAFGGDWSYEIIKHELTQGMFVVHARLTARAFDNSTPYLISKDGIGTCPVTMVNGQARDLGADLKTACTDALKRAAILFRVGVQLYQRDNQKNSLVQQAAMAQQDQQHQQAQPQQVNSVRVMLQRYQYPEHHACGALGVQSLDQLTTLTVSQLLAGQHPLIAWLNEQVKTAHNQATPRQQVKNQPQEHSVLASDA